MTSPAIDRDVRPDVTEVLIRYATAIDRRDWALFRTCFTEDCHADYGDIGVWDGVEAITEFMQSAHIAMGHTLHRISNEVVTRSGSSVSARCYVDAVLLDADDRGGVNTLGFYDDELVHTDRGWKIARRRFTLVRVSRIAGS